MCCARGCGHVDGAAGEELARIVKRIRKRWPKTRVRGDGGPRRDVVRRQRRRLPVRPVPQRPPDGARRQAVAQVAQPLRFDRRGLASVLRLPLPDPGVLEPHAAGGRESGVASSRPQRPLRRDLPEPQAGGGADPVRETLLRARGEQNQGAATCSPTGHRPRHCSPTRCASTLRLSPAFWRRRFGDSTSPAPGTTGPKSVRAKFLKVAVCISVRRVLLSFSSTCDGTVRPGPGEPAGGCGGADVAPFAVPVVPPPPKAGATELVCSRSLPRGVVAVRNRKRSSFVQERAHDSPAGPGFRTADRPENRAGNPDPASGSGEISGLWLFSNRFLRSAEVRRKSKQI